MSPFVRTEPVQIFADASGGNTDRFHSFALLSGTQEQCDLLRQALNEYPPVEWKKINGDSQAQKAALKYITILVDYLRTKSVRLDVISWDRQDKRHQIGGRDDTENRARMFYHVLVSIGRLYGAGRYHIFLDEGECFD